MMPNINSPYNKFLYTIKNTLSKITSTSSIYFQKLTFFGIVFENEIMHYNLWQERKRQINVKSR